MSSLFPDPEKCSADYFNEIFTDYNLRAIQTVSVKSEWCKLQRGLWTCEKIPAELLEGAPSDT